MEPSTYVIKGRPKVKSLAVAAGISLAGMLLVGLATVFAWGDIPVIGGLGAAGVGIGLVLTTQEAARKASVEARMNADGFLLLSSRTQFGLEWKDVSRVSMRGNELVLRDKKGHEAKVVAPPGSEPAELDNLAQAMARHLDASRGYGQPPVNP